jgi:ubiquinone/menaquinone biosynthesis C-methylase UbiE
MKINLAERLMVNNPIRSLIQKYLINWSKQAMAISAQASILEIGCGRGEGARRLFEEFRPAVLHAMDVDLQMIRQALKRLSELHKTKICLYLGDAMQLPYRNEVFDAVFGFGVIHHIPDWRGALTEISRVLKPGGVYFIEEFYPPLYLNFLAKRIFRHPEQDRFYSHDLKLHLREVNLHLEQVMEMKKFGILGVCRKKC